MVVIVAKEIGETIRYKKGTILVTRWNPERKRTETVKKAAIGTVRAMVVIGRSKAISSDAILAAVSKSIPIVFTSLGGKVKCYVVPPTGKNPEVRMRQYNISESLRLEIAREMIKGKVKGQRYFLYDLNRYHGAEEINKALLEMQEILNQLSNAGSVEEVKSLEAKSANVYWETLKLIWGKYGFDKRKTRFEKPDDPVNRALNFLYTILSGLVIGALMTTSLDPYMGIIHEFNTRRPALVYDLMEEFRPVVDRAVNAAMKEREREELRVWNKHFFRGIERTYYMEGYKRSGIGFVYEQARRLERSILRGMPYKAFVVRS